MNRVSFAFRIRLMTSQQTKIVNIFGSPQAFTSAATNAVDAKTGLSGFLKSILRSLIYPDTYHIEAIRKELFAGRAAPMPGWDD